MFDKSESNAIRTATRLESVADIRSAAGQQTNAGPTDSLRPSSTRQFRPIQRPPIAQVCIVDDTGDGGEWIRVRGERVVIGRVEGDILISHDEGVSGKHFELYRALFQGKWRWYVRDLSSRNGTFARVASAELLHEQELLIGSRRFRLLIGSLAGQEEPPQDGDRTTRPWQPVSSEDVLPGESTLVEVLPTGFGQRYLLSGDEVWIGSETSKCAIAIADDPFVSPQHARLFRGTRTHWCVENNASLNGTWLRISKISLDVTGQFQAGEQRFVVKIDQ